MTPSGRMNVVLENLIGWASWVEDGISPGSRWFNRWGRFIRFPLLRLRCRLNGGHDITEDDDDGVFYCYECGRDLPPPQSAK